MMNSENIINPVRLVTLNDNRQDIIRAMLCQVDFDAMHYKKGSRLFFVENDLHNKDLLRDFVSIAVRQKVDLLVFPELTVPKEFVEELYDVANENDMIIIAGTHYKRVEGGYTSLCPIVLPNHIYETQKITPAPSEKSAFKEGTISGNEIFCFRGSKIGDFAVLICLDYTNTQLKDLLDKDELDFLIVSACNPKSKGFFYHMQTDVQGSRDGLYILYSNVISKILGVDGRSSLFGIMDNGYKEEFVNNKVTDLEPENKLFEFSENHRYCIFDIDVRHKRPYIGKNIYSEQNVKVVEQGFVQPDKRYEFLDKIGASEDRYKLIGQLYVKPKEYDEMLKILEEKGILIITGDPGIGKTYTAIHLLYLYFEHGYRPVWWYGLGKEDRDLQKDYLQNYEPQEGEIVYLEDPFGRTVFENKEELKTLFSNMLEKFKANRAKLIITSRSEVFIKFKKEVLSAERLEIFKKELNVRKPSYRHEDLIKMAKIYISKFTNWKSDGELMDLIVRGIETDQLISPMMIFNLVMNHLNTPTVKLLEESIKQARTVDLDTQLADEIKTLSKPSKILLYLVLLYAKKSMLQYKGMFEKIQSELFKKTPFEGSSFNYEIKGQDGYRIQRLGIQIPVYRFSHPSYEEALVGLVEKDQECYQIVETCLEEILKEDSGISVEIFKRFIIRYPQLLELFIKSVKKEVFDRFSEEDKLEITRKMILSGREAFMTIAQKVYPIKLLIQNLESEEKNIKIFVRRIRSLKSRQDEIGTYLVKWTDIFSREKIMCMNPQQFISCCKMALDIDPEVVFKIGPNLDKYDIIKKYIMLSEEKYMDELNQILSDTDSAGIYSDLKRIIPEDILANKNNHDRYTQILRKYYLKKKNIRGTIIVDEGALKAMKRGAKLYPIGIVDVYGDFEPGEAVKIICKAWNKRIKALTDMSASDIIKYKGLHSPEIYELEGQIIPTAVSRPGLRMLG